MAKKKQHKSKGFSKFCNAIFAHAKSALRNPDANYSYLTSGRYNFTLSTVDEVEHHTRMCGNEVYIGGMSGGSCWGTAPEQCTVSVPEEGLQFTPLDEFLETICPEITYLQYRKLERIAEVKTDQRTEGDYYGNSSNYLYRYVEVGKLYSALCEIDILKPEFGGYEDDPEGS